MLSYAAWCEVESSSNLDKILCDEDTVYQHVVTRLKAQGKFIHLLLSLEEIPDAFDVEIGKYIVEKQSIVSGILVDTQDNLGLLPLHNALHSCFTTSASCLLTIGVICSAVFKKKNLYVCVFFILIVVEKMDFHQLVVDINFSIFLMFGWSY